MQRRSSRAAAWLSIGAVAGLVTGTGQAAADGQFFQGDFSIEESVVVATVERGRITYGITRSDDDSSTTLVSALRSWQVGHGEAPLKLRLGPAVKFEEEEMKVGLRGTAERYFDFKTGGLFLLGEHVTVGDASFLLASWTSYSSGLGGEISLYKEAGDEVSPSLLLTAKVGNSGLTLRAGYKPGDERAFVGFSYSSF